MTLGKFFNVTSEIRETAGLYINGMCEITVISVVNETRNMVPKITLLVRNYLSFFASDSSHVVV